MRPLRIPPARLTMSVRADLPLSQFGGVTLVSGSLHHRNFVNLPSRLQQYPHADAGAWKGTQVEAS